MFYKRWALHIWYSASISEMCTADTRAFRNLHGWTLHTYRIRTTESFRGSNTYYAQLRIASSTFSYLLAIPSKLRVLWKTMIAD